MTTTTSAQFVSSGIIDAYTSNNQIGAWGESFKAGNSQSTGGSSVAERDNKMENRETVGMPNKYDQEANKSSDKTLRRLAQNREAARKSRLKKKAYVQQLEVSRMKLSQLEQELQRARQQGMVLGSTGDSTCGLHGAVNSGIAAFEMEYAHWVDEQNLQTGELRAALQQHVSDIELRILIEGGMNHFEKFFHLKSIAVKSDVFFLMSGTWKTPVERFFMWIGGFRPSELLKVIIPHLDPLTEQQFEAIYNLQQSSQQAEDALSQGLDRLKQTLAEALALDPLGSSGVSNYMEQMAAAMRKLEALENFVNQADHLRQQALQQMFRILTIRQSARGLLALGDYFHRLRALSSLWSARPHYST